MLKINSELRDKLIVAIVAAIIGSLLTTFIKPYIELKFEQTRVAKLVQDIQNIRIESLPEEIRDQVSLLPIKYTLKHSSGREAKNITIYIKGSEPLKAPDLNFDNRSESYTIDQVDSQTIKINVPSIRPQGFISFDTILTPQNKVTWDERIADGTIVSDNVIENKSWNRDFLPWAAVVIFFSAIWIVIPFFLWKKFSIAKERLNSFEEDNVGLTVEEKDKLVQIFIIFLIYDLVTNFLPISLPRIPFNAFFYALFSYILIVNYQSIKLFLNKETHSYNQQSTALKNLDSQVKNTDESNNLDSIDNSPGNINEGV